MNFKDQHITLLGLGRSSVAAARLLLREGAIPFVSDSGDARGREDYAVQLEALGVEYELGTHSPKHFEHADALILSPGVPASAPIVETFRKTGKPILAELELASRFAKAPIYAITGTNGKTTSTELLAVMLRACGQRVTLSGNNNTALSEAVLDTQDTDIYVVEVSSYQLECVDTFRPAIACVLNLSPDHLGRHGTMENYGTTKARLMMNQRGGDHALLNADDEQVSQLSVPEAAHTLYFSCTRKLDQGIWSDGDDLYHGDTKLVSIQVNPLPGQHNLENVVATLAMVYAGGYNLDQAISGLKTFPGVAHRIEQVALQAGITWYNDSKSTNIDSLRVALESFTEPIILIAGGQGKGTSYESLQPLIHEKVKHCICIGEDGPKLAQAFSGHVPCTQASTMQEAVQRSHTQATPGDIVLLSPGCASFDWYNNFEERGNDFKTQVQTLISTSHCEVHPS